MLKAEKRHRICCRFDQYDRARTKCACAYHVIRVLNGTFFRRSLKTSNYETAIRTIRKWESLGAARESQSLSRTLWALLCATSGRATSPHFSPADGPST